MLILRPNLIIKWMRPANYVDSSNLKPEVSKDVPKSNQIRSPSFHICQPRISYQLQHNWCLGFTSIVFEGMYDVMELSLKSCAFVIRSMLADQPYSEVGRTHGESEVQAFFVEDLGFLKSNSFSCCTQYSAS